jgi:hypothetical protein
MISLKLKKVEISIYKDYKTKELKKAAKVLEIRLKKF